MAGRGLKSERYIATAKGNRRLGISDLLRRAAKIGREWRRSGANGENVGFFHSCPLHVLGHEWRPVGHEWARSGTNEESGRAEHASPPAAPCWLEGFRLEIAHEWADFAHEWARSRTNGE